MRYAFPVSTLLRCEGFHASQRVDVLGEICDWRNAIALTKHADGSFSATLDLPTGVYQYKWLVDGASWELDSRNPRTRSFLGQRNSVVVVDGAPEPLLFAAAPPWVEELSRGGIRALVGVRRDSSGRAELPRIAYREQTDAEWSEATVEKAFEEDEHVFFTARAPTSAPRLGLRVSAGSVSFQTSWARGPNHTRTPAWWKRAALYTVFVDRFRPAHDRGEGETPWEVDPGKLGVSGGHLDGIRRSLSALEDLGITTLYLTPVHIGASVHRYDIVDPLTVDPALGGEASYDALVREAAAYGMCIVQDISFAHVGFDFPPYRDVREHGLASRFASWFVWKDGRLVHYGERTDAPLLNLAHPEVEALTLSGVEYWAKRGAKGLRLDMTAEVPLSLGRRMRRRFRDLVPDGVVFGEIVPEHAWRWQKEGVVDAATDFGFHEVISQLVCSPEPAADAAWARLERSRLLRGGDTHRASVRFASTHDHPRLATRAFAAGTLCRLPAAYVMLATMPGVPMLLYGEEAGMRSNAAHFDVEDVWPDRAPLPWPAPGESASIRALIRDLLRARRTSPALVEGEATLLFSDACTLVYRREADGDVVDVVLNFSSEAVTLALDDDELPGLVPIAAAGACEVTLQNVRIPPFGALVARREGPFGRAVVPARARFNLVLRDREFVDSRIGLAARPSRFFFSVTERCNLRCEHCITNAPELTKSGAARTMTPRLLDALRDDFGFANYFAFVHGGESLTAPILFDVLKAIKERRGLEPYAAHLLSNGVLLSASMAERLVESGISSISVSLDGATARTNDRIRTGGRFETIVKNVADVMAFRRRASADLRFGLSYVVLAQNVTELSAFVDLAASLGVDWVKIEEGVPATAFAKNSLVACSLPDIRLAIDAAIARGRTHGLVMVDHTTDSKVWRCRLNVDEPARSFLEADEYANRCEIHPCRTPWETVCVEPNGDVRAQDFYGPILGNITTSKLAVLWNEPAARDIRQCAIRERLCGEGAVVCL